MLSKENLLKIRLGSINEAVFKQGDLYKVKTTLDVPKSLINAFVSKAKKEHNVDPRETWSDMDLAEMFVNYITATYLNIDSIPVDAIMGAPETEVTAEVTPGEATTPVATTTPEATPAATATPETTPEVTATPTAETPATGPAGEVQA